MKTKELIKRALRNPHLFTEAELVYLNLIKSVKKKQKKIKKQQESDYLR